MTDYERNDVGTINKLCLLQMTLKAALAYIDCDSRYSKEAQEHLAVLDELRKELPDE